MNYKRFIEITHKTWTDYFKLIEEKISQEIIKAEMISGEKAEVLFPSILLITQTKSHFLAELLGANKNFNGLKIKAHKETSVARYLNQFNTDESEPFFAAAIDDCENVSFENLCISHYIDFEELKFRFPFLELFQTKLIHRPEAKGALVSLGKNFRDVFFNNCLLVNIYLSSVRVKHILHLTLINKEMLAAEYEIWLKKKLNDNKSFPGLHACQPGMGHSLTVASQFASTYLFYGLRETTIGEFLNQHHEIIYKAVGSRKLIYEPYLEWIEKPNENTKYKPINPDLMIEREDGFYDIYDLKTALLNKKSLTKGDRSRRRFIDYVNEGLAQLANYGEYFNYFKNCEYALNKYGINIKQPNLVLVVGNYDNVDKTEIEEASRLLKNISIIDYDSFLQHFLSKK